MENSSSLIPEPTLITTKNQLIKNIETIEYYLTEGNEEDRKETSNLIRLGNCFVVYMIEKDYGFAPSRFLGYINNNPNRYPSKDFDGTDTNKAINKILNSKPFKDDELEKKYLNFCDKLSIKPSSKKRKYWTLELSTYFSSKIELTGEFPEGRIVERIHKTRERNYQVIDLAKSNFKKQNGKLFCQVCKFDFEDKYGDIGKDFIEGHHTIAISEMPPEHKTKPDEIAILCSNCHKMIHKRRPWLAIEQLSKLLKK